MMSKFFKAGQNNNNNNEDELSKEIKDTVKVFQTHQKRKRKSLYKKTKVRTRKVVQDTSDSEEVYSILREAPEPSSLTAENGEKKKPKKRRKKRSKRGRIMTKTTPRVLNKETFDAFHPGTVVRPEEMSIANAIDPFKVPEPVSLPENSKVLKEYREACKEQNKEVRDGLAIAMSRYDSEKKFVDAYKKGKRAPRAIRELTTKHGTEKKPVESQETSERRKVAIQATAHSDGENEEETVHDMESYPPGVNIDNGNIIRRITRQEPYTGTPTNSQILCILNKRCDRERLMFEEAKEAKKKKRKKSKSKSIENGTESEEDDDYDVDDDDFAMNTTQMISPMRDLTSRLTSAVGKTSRSIIDRAAYGLQDGINEDISFIAKLQASKEITDFKTKRIVHTDNEEQQQKTGNGNEEKDEKEDRSKIDLSLEACSKDTPLDAVDKFYTGQLAGPSLRDLVATVKKEREKMEKEENKESFRSYKPSLMGPKERLMRALIQTDEECDEKYRWRADKGLDPRKLTYRPLGTPVTMEYASNFLRESVGDERPCIRGYKFCICVLLPQMQMAPNTNDTQRTDSGFVGREFFTKNEMDVILKNGKWPAIRGCCFLCLVFEQTLKCATAIEMNVMFPYQIQRFRIQIEESVGFSKNQCLPVVTDDGEKTGIVDNALEFRVNDYIADVTTKQVGDDMVQVKCYSFQLHHF